MLEAIRRRSVKTYHSVVGTRRQIRTPIVVPIAKGRIDRSHRPISQGRPTHLFVKRRKGRPAVEQHAHCSTRTTDEQVKITIAVDIAQSRHTRTAGQNKPARSARVGIGENPLASTRQDLPGGEELKTKGNGCSPRSGNSTFS